MVCRSECKRSVITSLTQLKYGFITSVNAAGVASLSSIVTNMTRSCKAPSCTLVVEGSSLSESVLIPCFCVLRGMALEMVGERP